MNWEQVTEELNKPLERGAVKQRQQGTFKLSYIEGWHAIAEANRIFGHGNWDRETCEMVSCGQPYQNDKQNWVVNYVCRVRISVGATSVSRDGSGFGSGIDRDLGRAHESAIKEAETDATKRALMTFGWPFGLALYDKTQEHVSDGNGHAEPLPPPLTHGTKFGPGDFPRETGDASAAKSKKLWAILHPEMKKTKLCGELNDWWIGSTNDIKEMSAEFRWKFFIEMIGHGLALCTKPMAVNLFWANHESALKKLQKADRYLYEALEEEMVTRTTWLTDPDAKVEFINAG